MNKSSFNLKKTTSIDKQLKKIEGDYQIVDNDSTRKRLDFNCNEGEEKDTYGDNDNDDDDNQDQ